MVRTCTIRHLREEGMTPSMAPSRLAVLRANVWRQTGITCLFLDGTPKLHGRVAWTAQRWSRYAWMHVTFVNRGPADVRITFKGDGSWSYVGTDALNIPQDEPTMCYGWLENSFANGDFAEIKRVVLHEFGHAIGFIHEHQNPLGGIVWNEDAVYKYYAGPPNRWDRETIYNNVLAPYALDMVNGGEYDAHSIMNYPIPREFVVDKAQATDWNNDLSPSDKNMAAVLYPRVIGQDTSAAITVQGKV